MHSVRSRDGTPIAFWRSGEGPALLLIHGATADHTTTWRRVISAFERNFTVYAMDRRGRGGSGDAKRYTLQHEAEDIRAVVDSIGTSVNVLGHSYGALCALEAALLTTSMRRLILYEGVPLRGTELYEPGIVAKLDTLLERGDIDGMLTVMYRDVAHIPPDEVDLLRSQRDAWAIRLGNAATLPRELRCEEGYTFDPPRFVSMTTPTLLLVGGDSPLREREHARGLAGALPDARVGVLPGQRHIAMHTAPELFVEEVMRFCCADPPANDASARRPTPCSPD